MRKKVVPKLRPFSLSGRGDCDNAKGHTTLVPPEKVEEMITLLIESLPDLMYIPVDKNLPVGEFAPGRCKMIPFTCKFNPRETRRLNASVRWDWGVGWQFIFYPFGLNERTIIHEVAHLPAWRCGHDKTFKFWMTYLTEQWFGREEPLIKNWKIEVTNKRPLFP